MVNTVHYRQWGSPHTHSHHARYQRKVAVTGTAEEKTFWSLESCGLIYLRLNIRNSVPGGLELQLLHGRWHGRKGCAYAHVCVNACVCSCVFVFTHMCVHAGVVGNQRTTCKISSFLHVGSMDIKLRCQAWWVAALPTYPTGPQLQFYLDICGS